MTVMVDVPDMSRLSLRDSRATASAAIPQDIDESSDRYLLKLKNYARSIPYGVESNARMQEMLDFIVLRIVQSVEAKDFDPGMLQWDSMLT
jgi:proteasome activator subunit 4